MKDMHLLVTGQLVACYPQVLNFLIFRSIHQALHSSNLSILGSLWIDRCNYSTKDGSEGYSSLPEVESALLSKGWYFPQETKWKVEIIKNKTDKEGNIDVV